MEKPKELSPADVYEYILYVETKHDSIVKQVAERGMLPVTYLQEVDRLRSRPSWLTSLPCLVQTDTKTGYRGRALLEKLDSYEVPASTRTSVQASLRKRALWAQDSRHATDEVLSTRTAPLHVRN